MAENKDLVRIADELEIRNLIARLAHAADDGDLGDYAQLFTEEATWGGGGQPTRSGRAEILEGARSRRQDGLAGPGAASRHVVTTTWLDLEGGVARGHSVYHFYIEIHSQFPKLASLGVYRDTFRKTDEGWKLAERLIEGDAKSLPSQTT